MPIFYFQVAGWRSHVSKLPHNIPRPADQVADILWHYLAEDEVLTLTLGILPCGASYLLTAATPDMNSDLRGLFVGRAYPASRFISLSPIEFRDRAALEQKLDKHQQKYRKNKKNEPDRDTSQANTHYTTAYSYDTVTKEGHNRAIFEYHRLVYRLCRGSIDPAEYDIKRVPFLDNIRAYSFAYTLHYASRFRPLELRRSEPMILDLGLAEWMLPASSIDMTVISSEYFTIQETARLTNPGKSRGDYMYGDTQSASRDELRDKLAERFVHKADAPILLFVQNASEAMDVLRFYGVDTSDWTSAFEPLVGKDLLQVGDRLPKEDAVKHEDAYGRGRYENGYGHGRRRSDRSRSPKRGSPAARPRSPTRHKQPPVYVVDVGMLYATMRRMPQEGLSIPQMAEDLDVKLEPPTDGRPMSDGWCAGNECRLVALIWRALASGNAIDEQLLRLQARPGRLPPTPAPLVPPPATPGTPGGYDDEDVDPNDIAPAAHIGAIDPYAQFEDDDYYED